MTSSPVTIPVDEQSISNIQQSNRNFQDVLDLEDRLCPGCKKSAVSEQGGLVVAFGWVSLSIHYVSPSHSPQYKYNTDVLRLQRAN